MRRFSVLVSLASALGGLAACAAEKEATPAAPAAAPAPAAPAPQAKPAWEEDWEQVLAGAKREGRVAVVATARDARIRRMLVEAFEKRYGIPVEFFVSGGAQAVPRIRTERQAGQYLWDIYIGGATTPLSGLKPIGALEPLEPVLILPEVKEPKNWVGGRLWFVDKDRTIVMMTLSTSVAFLVNTTLAKPEEFRSYRDLLDPKWKGKFIAIDPRGAGPGQALFHQFYAHKDLGPDFIRALVRQEPVIMRDEGLAIQWLGQGKSPVLMGAGTGVVAELVEQGVPIKEIDPRQIKEGGHMTSGPGSVTMLTKAPHPNAARLYLNWLLSKEGQSEFSKSSRRASLRVDTPREHLNPLTLPVDTFLSLDTEERLLERERVVGAFLREVLGQ